MKLKSLCLFFVSVLIAHPGIAIEVTGKVTSGDGKALSQVMVSVDNGDVQPGDVTVTVFTDTQGRYRIADLESIEGMTIRATLGGYTTTKPAARHVPFTATS